MRELQVFSSEGVLVGICYAQNITVADRYLECLNRERARKTFDEIQKVFWETGKLPDDAPILIVETVVYNVVWRLLDGVPKAEIKLNPEQDPSHLPNYLSLTR